MILLSSSSFECRPWFYRWEARAPTQKQRKSTWFTLWRTTPSPLIKAHIHSCTHVVWYSGSFQNSFWFLSTIHLWTINVWSMRFQFVGEIRPLEKAKLSFSVLFCFVLFVSDLGAAIQKPEGSWKTRTAHQEHAVAGKNTTHHMWWDKIKGV